MQKETADQRSEHHAGFETVAQRDKLSVNSTPASSVVSARLVPIETRPGVA